MATLLVIYVILLVTSMGFAAWVSILRNSRTCKSLIYFEDIAGLQRGSFVERSRRMDAPEIELQLLEQGSRRIEDCEQEDASRALVLLVGRVVLLVVGRIAG